MARIADVTQFLDSFAPMALAEDWDNVGLLVGNVDRPVSAVMTCLTLTPDVAAEAVLRNVQLVVSHHPLLFRPVQRLTADTIEGGLLLQLIEAGTAVYSPHTSYDSAEEGINQQLAECFELEQIAALRPHDARDEALAADTALNGAGRWGALVEPMTLAEFLSVVKQRLDISLLSYVGDPSVRVERVGVACGAAAEFIHDARQQQCQVLLTGEARFHDCLEARGGGIALVLTGHYASERPAVERLAEILAAQFSDLTVWASQQEADPINWA